MPSLDPSKAPSIDAGQRAADASAETDAHVAGHDTGEVPHQSPTGPGIAQALPACFQDHPRYKVVRLLGQGGMGSVFLAEHRLMERLVALKIIRPSLSSGAESAERFKREIRLAARLKHPHIVAAYDAEQIDDVQMLVMEYVEGVDLAQVIARDGKLSISTACSYAQQVALGLQHAHDFGMVHRDIKPHNLMLTADGQVKILDFGLAHLMTEVNNATQSGSFLGSVDYIAPEQAEDPRRADIRADIYSLGCTLYHLLAGRPPFMGGSLLQRLKAHAQSPPQRVPNLPDELWRTIGRMLAKAPQDRFQVPQEVATALEQFVERDAALIRSAPAASRTRRALAIVVGVAIVGAVISSFWPLRSRDAPPPPPAYKSALALLDQRQERQANDAIERLKQAIEEQPDSALLYSALANAYSLCADYGWMWADEAFAEASAAAEKALELDPESADAHLALAVVLHAYDCQWHEAEEEYLEALRLNPESADAHHWYAWFLLQQERVNEAKQAMKRAGAFGPDRVIILTNEGKIRYYARRYTEAEQHLLEALSINQDYRKAHWDLGYVYAEMGRLDDALKQFSYGGFGGLTMDGRDLVAARAYAYARNGRPEPARPLLVELISKADKIPLAYEIALVYGALGEKEEAFRWLQRAFDEHTAWRSYIKVDPRLDGLRADQRFGKYLELAGL